MPVYDSAMATSVSLLLQMIAVGLGVVVAFYLLNVLRDIRRELRRIVYSQGLELLRKPPQPIGPVLQDNDSGEFYWKGEKVSFSECIKLQIEDEQHRERARSRQEKRS